MNSLLEYDPDIGYRYLPHLKLRLRIPGEDGGFLLRTNALGFRNDREFERDGPQRRVLVFGDSFTAGDNVSNGQRYSDVLETLLPGVEMHNFGLPGTGTDQHFIAYSKFAAGARCEAVVIAVLVENIRRITSAYRPSSGDGEVAFVAKPYFELVDGALVRRHDPVPRELVAAADLERDAAVDRGGRFSALRTLVKSLGLKDAVQSLTRYQPTPEYDSARDPAWRLLRAILLAWRALITDQPVVLMPIPLYQHVEGTADPFAYRARFAELAQDGDFVLHDPIEDFWSYDAQTRRSFRFKTDVHLTNAGHRALAQSLSKTLAPLLSKTSSVALS